MIKEDIPVLLSCGEECDELFIKVPDDLIMEMKDDITVVVYSWLGFSKTFLNLSYINIMDIIKCFYKEFPSRKPILFDRILNSLSYLREEEYIMYNDNEINNLKYNIINSSNTVFHTTDKFDPSTYFTIFYYKDFKKIMINSKPKTLDLNTLIFLYACSFMNFGRNDQPRVFYKSVEGASEELGIRRHTIGDALTFLSSAECGVLKRCETFLTQPNIYVLNDDTADVEIKKALARLDVNVMPKHEDKELQSVITSDAEKIVDSTHEVKEPTVAKNETAEEGEIKTDFEVHEDIPDYFKKIEWDDDNEVPSSYEEYAKSLSQPVKESHVDVKLSLFDEDDKEELSVDEHDENYKYEPTEEFNDSPTNKPKPRVILDIFKEDEDDNTEFLADKYYGRNIDYEKEFGSIGEEKSYFDSESFVEDDNFDGLF